MVEEAHENFEDIIYKQKRLKVTHANFSNLAFDTPANVSSKLLSNIAFQGVS